jgi:hypothetical protein
MCKAAMKAFDEGSELATLQNGTDSGSGNARTAVAAIPSFFALCLAVRDDLDIVEWMDLIGEKVVAILLYRTLFVSILTRK